MSHCQVREVLRRIEQSVPRRLDSDTESEDEVPPARRNVNTFQDLAVEIDSDDSLSDLEVKSEPDFDPEDGAETAPDLVPERVVEPENDFDPSREADRKPDFDTEREDVPEPILKSELELRLEAKVEPEPEHEVAVKPESESDLEIEIKASKSSRSSRRRANRRTRRGFEYEDPASTSKEDDETSEDLSRQELSQNNTTLDADSPDNGSLPDHQPACERLADIGGYEENSPHSSTMTTPPNDGYYPVEGVDEILLTVKPNNLLVTTDMSQRLAAGDPDTNRRKHTLRERIFRKAMIIEYPELLLNPHNHGLSMSVHRNPDGSQYYTFEHSPDYQKMHQKFRKSLDDSSTDFVLNLDNALKGAHLEALVEIFDSLCRSGDLISAQNLIQRTIAIMQYSAMPSFNISDFHTRLPYKYVENRTFHILVLKYIYLLSNKACHSNALELCKMMLNLDPSDPLAVMFVVDTIAIRAREFQWLIEVLDFWAYKRSAHFMFNLVFSHALAFFQCTRKSNNNDSNNNFANELLRNAIVRFPYVVTALVNNIKSPAVEGLKNYALYKVLAPVSASAPLIKLMEIYAKLIWPRWNDRFAITWFVDNARAMAELYENDAEIRNMIVMYADSHVSLFGAMPVQLSRHLCIIKPMSSWIMDEDADVPVVNGYSSFDPIPPPDGVDRNDYNNRTPSPVIKPTNWYEFFTSILPSWDPGA